MTSSDFDAIQDEQQEIRKQYRFSLQLFYGVVLVGVGIWIGSRLFADDGGYVTNLYTEFISIGVTVFILDLLARRRQNRYELNRLIDRVRSENTLIAAMACEELVNTGRAHDGSLHNRDLSYANLYHYEEWQGAQLNSANLTYANLSNIILNRANLEQANMTNASLDNISLRRANLRHSHLVHAQLVDADLFDADLTGANLRGAILTDAVLENALVKSVVLNRATMLPDGTYWTPGRSLTEFGAVEIPPDATP